MCVWGTQCHWPLPRQRFSFYWCSWLAFTETHFEWRFVIWCWNKWRLLLADDRYRDSLDYRCAAMQLLLANFASTIAQTTTSTMATVTPHQLFGHHVIFVWCHVASCIIKCYWARASLATNRLPPRIVVRNNKFERRANFSAEFAFSNGENCAREKPFVWLQLIVSLNARAFCALSSDCGFVSISFILHFIMLSFPIHRQCIHIFVA